MKTFSFIFCVLLLVSCGKKNTSGSRPDPSNRDQFITDAEIIDVANTRNGVMVQGTQANFAIPVTNVENIYRSKNLIGVIYNPNNNGLRIKIYNALGRSVFNDSVIMREPRLNVGEDVATVDYIDLRGNARVIAINLTGRVLLQFSAQAIRAKASHGVVAIAYRTNAGERAVAVKSDGSILLADNRTYIRPVFTIDPYVLIFRHSLGVEQFPH